MRMVTQPLRTCPEPNGRTSRVPLQSDRNQRHSRADRDVGGAFLEGCQLAGLRSAAFRKNEQRDAALAHYLRRRVHGLHRGPGIVARNGDVAGAGQVRAQQRNLEQAAFRKKTELHWNVCENHWRIHVAEVIGDENVASVRCNLLQAVHLHFHSAAPQKKARPDARHRDLPAAAGLKQGDDQAHQSESDGGKNDQRSGDEIRPEK